MQLKLSYCKLKIGCCKMYCESFMVNTKLDSLIDIQVIKRKESKYTTTKNYQLTKKDRDENRTKELQNNQKQFTKW